MSSSKFKIFGQPPCKFFHLRRGSLLLKVHQWFQHSQKFCRQRVSFASHSLAKSKLATLPDQRSRLTFVDTSDHARGEWELVLSSRAVHPLRIGVKFGASGSIIPPWSYAVASSTEAMTLTYPHIRPFLFFFWWCENYFLGIPRSELQILINYRCYNKGCGFMY